MKSFLLVLVSLAAFIAKAQEQHKYDVGFAVGWLTTLDEAGPRGMSELGDVKFLHPWYLANGNLYFDYHLNNTFLLGIEVGIDQSDFGYVATPLYSFSGLSSGQLSAGAAISLYKAGLRIGTRKAISDRVDITGILNPAFGYYIADDWWADTANRNAYMHDVRPPGSGKIQYIKYPPYQKSGLHFTAKATVILAYRVSKRLGLTVDIAYQQGFSNFFTDSTSIRQYEPTTLKLTEQVYYTKLRGTSLQYHIGLRYRFGKK